MPERPISHEEIKAILGRHDGSKTEVARRAEVTSQAVSMWLSGPSKSANIQRHAEAVARELLRAEVKAAKELLRQEEKSVA